MKSGFTLVELLVMVVIVFLLGFFLLPTSHRGPTKRERDAMRRKGSIRLLAVGLLQFKDDHDWRFPAEADFMGGNPFWVGGAVAEKPGTLDPARPLAGYIKDLEIFECPHDTGTSAFDNPKHCYTAWGTSYLWAAKDIPEVGITGMLGRKYTDPLLGASSLKIMIFEPPLCVTKRPLPKKDQWYGPEPRSMVAFLDGHSDLVKPAAPQSEPMTEAGLTRLIKEKRPYY